MGLEHRLRSKALLLLPLPSVSFSRDFLFLHSFLYSTVSALQPSLVALAACAASLIISKHVDICRISFWIPALIQDEL